MNNTQYTMQYLDEIYENLTALGEKEQKGERVFTFLARHKITGKIVVKKYVDADRIMVYKKLSQIEDIHLENIYEYASDENRGIVLVEYISGTSLQEKIREKKIFSEEEACDIMIELCKVMQKIHAAGIVHRDINPNNIMISGDGILKLVDFGIAREKKDEQEKDTMILGTPGYAAPEQFGFLQTDERTDIYAAGVLFNELLTGCLPGKRIYEEYPLGEIIRRCTEIDVRQRYQSDEELLEALCGKPEIVKDTYVSKWLPGFRTGVVWKNVMAVVGYFFMIAYSISSVGECMVRWDTALLETVALILYIWIPVLLAANAAYWNKRWILGKLDWRVTLILKILLCMAFFYNGLMLDSYVRYDLLGMVKKY
ncbi:MAG: serine/threonine protein kinase [Ruminococcus sp.]|nr:serine/threonine protein kinase [Ruminococcus sp.]